MVAALFATLSMLLLAFAVLLVFVGRKRAYERQVQLRLSALAFDAPAPKIKPNELEGALAPLARWQERVGLDFVSPAMALVFVISIGLIGWLTWTIWGPMIAFVIWGLVLVALGIVPQILYQQRVTEMVDQMPLLIDQITRAMVTGRNVEGALKLALETTPYPLREVIERVYRQVDLGADLGSALVDAANLHDIQELHLLSLAMNTSRVYGGSPKDMLESIANVIRQRDQMRRELKSMTGEIRVSAWILGLLPTGMAAFMLWKNPKYLLEMWEHPSGQNFLIGAVGWQICGALVMWRMIKSV